MRPGGIFKMDKPTLRQEIEFDDYMADVWAHFKVPHTRKYLPTEEE